MLAWMSWEGVWEGLFECGIVDILKDRKKVAKSDDKG